MPIWLSMKFPILSHFWSLESQTRSPLTFLFNHFPSKTLNIKQTYWKRYLQNPPLGFVCLFIFEQKKSSSLGFLIIRQRPKTARLKKPRVAASGLHLGRFRRISLAQGTRTSSIAFDSRHITWNDFTSVRGTRGTRELGGCDTCRGF